jgi:transketolase
LLHDEELRERFFECRIAEQNMLSCAGGLAAGGKLTFVSTFGKFLVRAYDQLEMGLISQFNLKLVGSHVGVSLAADGPSQMALPDVAFFRALTTVRTHEGQPLLYLLQPADAYAAYALTVAMAAHEGPCYLRTLRPDVPFLYHDATAFSLGGHHVLTAGHDLCIIAAGYMVHEARKALPLLKEQGIAARLQICIRFPLMMWLYWNWPRKVTARYSR